MRIRHLAGIFLVSCTTLSLEITLIRYFSVSQSYHFAFLVVSIAFLGYGASGSILSLLEQRLRQPQNGIPAAAAAAYSLSILGSFLLVNLIPFDLNTLTWNTAHIWMSGLFYILFGLPFFFAGLILSLFLCRSPGFVSRIYFADLIGAGCGTLLPLVLFAPGGDRGAVIIISILPLLAALCFQEGPEKLGRGLMLCALAGQVLLSLFAPQTLEFRISPFKALPAALRYPGASSLFTRWNAISRVDGIQSPAVRHAPGLSLSYDGTLPDQIGLCTDGGEMDSLTRWSGFEDPRLAFLDHLPTKYPFLIQSDPEVLILSSNGNLDVLAALNAKAAHISVFESNPLIPRIIKNEAAAFSGDLYRRNDISLGVSNSRSVLHRPGNQSRFDLIILPLKDIFGAASTGNYGLGENYLLTRESFQAMLSCLKTGGMVCQSFYLLPPPRSELRALATWVETLERMGRQPAEHLAALRSWGTIHLFIKKTPLTENDTTILKDFADRNLFDCVHYPGMSREEANRFNQFASPVYFDLVNRLLSPSTRQALYHDYLFKLRPVSDDSPFFDNQFKLGRLRDTYISMGQKWHPFLQGELLVLVLLIQASAAAFVLIMIPVLIFRRRQGRASRFQGLFYFSLIGTAFMFVEITLIQKFILFLGDPLSSTAVIIFSLLLASGLGSLSSKKLLPDPAQGGLGKILTLCSAFILAYLILIPHLPKILGGIAPGLRTVLMPALIFPLGFLMGIPFPSGIRILAKSRASIPWAWAANAFSSVISSVLALLVAFHLGYRAVLALAAGAYLLALLFLRFSGHGDKSNP
jgi:hypothetical protein